MIQKFFNLSSILLFSIKIKSITIYYRVTTKTRIFMNMFYIDLRYIDFKYSLFNYIVNYNSN